MTQSMCDSEKFTDQAKDVWNWLLLGREYGEANKDGRKVEWVQQQWLTPNGDVFFVRFVESRLEHIQRFAEFVL